MNTKDTLAQKIIYCEKIRNELAYSYGWISREPIDAQWVLDLASDPAKKERVSAFCGRFGRMQDYFSDRLLRAWVEAVGENVGAALQNFSIAERAGILTIKSEEVPELRQLRNDLTHDYIDDSKNFAEKLISAIEVTPKYFDMLDNLKAYSKAYLGIST